MGELEMELSKFVSDFAGQFEDNDHGITETVEFRKLASWDSLTGMAVLYMIEKDYSLVISIENFLKLQTPKEIFDYIQKYKER
jgi:acyl carrier protein